MAPVCCLTGDGPPRSISGLKMTAPYCAAYGFRAVLIPVARKIPGQSGTLEHAPPAERSNEIGFVPSPDRTVLLLQLVKRCKDGLSLPRAGAVLLCAAGRSGAGPAEVRDHGRSEVGWADFARQERAKSTKEAVKTIACGNAGEFR